MDVVVAKASENLRPEQIGVQVPNAAETAARKVRLWTQKAKPDEVLSKWACAPNPCTPHVVFGRRPHRWNRCRHQGSPGHSGGAFAVARARTEPFQMQTIRAWSNGPRRCLRRHPTPLS